MKQEEIREGLAESHYRSDYCGGELGEFIDLPVYLQNLYLAGADEGLEFLASKGVVIGVEKELPPNPYPKDIFTASLKETSKIQREKLGDELTTSANGAFGRHVYNFCQGDMLNAGYVAVEPLIEVIENE